ncbi:MAG: hypothetical protein ACREGK_11095, partial [Geminicoccales bacterium]
MRIPVLRPISALGVLAVAATLALLVRPAPAQHDDHAHHAHGDAEKLGTVRFPNSCKPEVQAGFTRSLALLHSFGYERAGQAFSEVAAQDPHCALAQWGIAMSNFHTIWAPPTEAEFAAGQKAAARAAEIGGNPPNDERERDWIAAIGAFYAPGSAAPHIQRVKAFEHAMAGVRARHPKDDEAAIFHALALLGVAYNSPADKNYPLQKQAAQILNGLLPRHPDHPGVAHYMIHSFDYPDLASLAEQAARSYAKIAPDSPHALHMPSHIFTRLGLWSESVASNLASAESAARLVARTHPGASSFDGLHAMDYLEYAYLQTAQDDKAREVLDGVTPVKSFDLPNFAAGYALAAIPARWALERGDWAAAAALTVRPETYPWAEVPYAEAIVHFARAVGAARGGQVEIARAAHARLAEIQAALAAGPKAGFDWAAQVEIQRLAAEGWLRHAEGKHAEAERLLRAAADLEDSTDKHPVTPGSVLPAREQLADLLLEHGKAGEALREYAASLET